MFFFVSVAHYLATPKVRSVLSGVDVERHKLTIDEFDAAQTFPPGTPIVEIDPQGLVPTQDDVIEDYVLWLAKVPSAELPPIKVVVVLGQLRILDGHHRACAAAVAARKVRAWVLKLDA